MKTQYSGAIKGMSIATVALSAFAVLAAAVLSLVIVLVVVFGVAAAPSAIDYSYSYGYSNGPHYLDTDDMNATVVGLFVVLGGIGIFALLLLIAVVVLTLIAGIKGLMGAGNLEKRKNIFVWSIIAAAACLLTFRWISMVLFILVAIFSYRDALPESAPQAIPGEAYTADNTGFAPRGSAAPVPPVGVQPTASTDNAQVVSAAKTEPITKEEGPEKPEQSEELPNTEPEQSEELPNTDDDTQAK
ncbi:MAG: hypothetical protein ACLU06_03955 [Eggerthellaceae bacterium]